MFAVTVGVAVTHRRHLALGRDHRDRLADHPHRLRLIHDPL
jgi:hypothetical protein